MNHYTPNTMPVQALQMYTEERYRALNRSPFGDSVRKAVICVDSLRLIPFTIVKTAAIYDQLTSVLMYDLKDNLVQDITSLINPTVILDQSATAGYIRYFAAADFASELPTGQYYLKLTDGTGTWYTEDFKSCKLNASIYPRDYIKIEYYNTYDFAGFVYQNDYKNYFYLDTVIRKVDSKILNGAKEDENNNREKTLKVVDPQYMIKVLSKDFLYDVLQNVSQHDTINITNTTGQEQEAENIEPSREDVANEFTNTSIEFGFKGDTVSWRASDGEENNISLVTKYLVDENGDPIVDENGDNILYVD